MGKSLHTCPASPAAQSGRASFSAAINMQDRQGQSTFSENNGYSLHFLMTLRRVGR